MHRLPSRRMPPLGSTDGPPLHPVLHWLVVALLWSIPLVVVAQLIALAQFSIPVALFVGALLAFLLLQLDTVRRRSSQRGPGSLCDFVRSYDYRRIDTWVLRAVYEELSDVAQCPIRRNDGLFEELAIDDEDFYDDVAPSIAYRSGRSLDQCEQNPYFAKLKTVDDLVQFFLHQPRRNPSTGGL